MSLNEICPAEIESVSTILPVRIVFFIRKEGARELSAYCYNRDKWTSQRHSQRVEILIENKTSLFRSFLVFIVANYQVLCCSEDDNSFIVLTIRLD